MRLSAHVPAMLAIALLLSACADGLPFRRAAPPEGDAAVPVAVEPGPEVVRPQTRDSPRRLAAVSPIQPRGRTAEALDTTTPAEREAAAAAARSPGGQPMGQTLAALGNPAEPGFWLVTGLVDRARQGRVSAASGAGVAVELRPSGGPAGSGSQISLAALRALGLPLTDLAAVMVFALD